MSKEKTIAILIPCYNAAPYLPQLFEGIKNQTIPFDEIICYDDASTDNTIAVAESLGAKVIKGIINKGAAFARNRLAEACTTEWLHFHDADDFIDTNFVKKMRDAIIDEKLCLLSDMLISEKKTGKIQDTVSYSDINYCTDVVSYFLKKNGFAIIGLYHKSVFDVVGGFLENLRGNEDPDFHVRLALAGYRFRAINEALVTNSIHSNSYSQLHWMQCLEDRLYCYKNYLEHLDESYHPILGRDIALLGAYFYYNGNKRSGRKAESLVVKTKVNKIETTTHGAQFLTAIFGIPFYFRLLEIRYWLKTKFNF